MYKYRMIKEMFILVTILFFISGVFLLAERGAAESSIELKVNDANEAEVQTPSEPIIIPDNDISITETMNEVKEIKKEEKSKQGLLKFRSLKDLRNGDEFSFGGRMWVLINPTTGFAMMKERISTMNLELVDFDKEDANEILAYFDTIYYNQLSSKDKELMESRHFGLTKLEKSLYITMYLKSSTDLKDDGSLEDSNIIQSQDKKSKENSINSILRVFYILLILVLILLVLGFCEKNKK
ncbi:hypothetical protein EYB33_12105 [Lysinibacillus sphaericus]|uniref:hypothetical protein n=1 Tax=Lysinibacillus TaxID=400634 RepID=UPI00084AEE71|nr:hypothetical protein [Lysinibacillus sphaericus]OEC01285.1 hypothetical protein GY31_13370 [Lysinibacillus sphaericus]UDK97003.1 hypothetical protein EYB33_12105 [Lysinibacillus sphaericus]